MSFSLEQGSAISFATALTAAGHVSGLTGAATTHSTPLLAFSIDGYAYTKAAAAGAATPTVDGASGAAITIVAGQARAVVWAVSDAGVTKVFAGPVVVNDGTVAANLPTIPPGFAPIAVHTIQGGATLSGTWTLGSSNWNATGLTLGSVAAGVAKAISQLPARPLVLA